MNEQAKNAVETYQCPGCVCGNDISCYKNEKVVGIGCSSHVAGTIIFPIGKIALGMPKGFNRVKDGTLVNILQSTDDFKYNNLNVPVWKRLDENGNTLIRGLSPRIDSSFLHVILGDNMDKFDCFEVDDEFLEGID